MRTPTLESRRGRSRHEAHAEPKSDQRSLPFQAPGGSPEGGAPGSGGRSRYVASERRATLKLNIIPLSVCSAMWQCAIHSPGLATSSRMSTVSPAVRSTVSFQTRFLFRLLVSCEDEEVAGSMNVERVMHRVIGIHLVDQRDLHPVADGERPTHGAILGTSLPVDELPDHVARIRCPVDLRH